MIKQLTHVCTLFVYKVNLETNKQLMIKRVFISIITYLVVISCVMPYSWVESNKSIPPKSSVNFDKSISIKKVIDSRIDLNYTRSMEKYLPEAVKKEFKKEFSRHFLIKDTLTSDIMVEIEIEQFDFWDRKKDNIDGAIFVASTALLVGAGLNLDQSQSDIEDSNCCDNEIVAAERLFLVSAALYVGSLIRPIIKSINGKYFLDKHEIKLSATLFDKNKTFIKRYQGSASSDYSSDKGDNITNYDTKLNESFSDAINEIIEKIYADKTFIDQHFNNQT
jgi:hypothetical protein